MARDTPRPFFENLVTLGLVISILLALGAPLASAQDRGPVTNLPIPRFVTLKASEANARRGPSLSHRIDWVFKRRNMPLEVYGEYENWRRVRDLDGVGGWIHFSLLSGVRYVMVTKDLAALHARAEQDAQIVARLELNVLAKLDACTPEWCKVKTAGYSGWIAKADIWGVYDTELRD